MKNKYTKKQALKKFRFINSYYYKHLKKILKEEEEKSLREMKENYSEWKRKLNESEIITEKFISGELEWSIEASPYKEKHMKIKKLDDEFAHKINEIRENTSPEIYNYCQMKISEENDRVLNSKFEKFQKQNMISRLREFSRNIT